MRQSTLVRLGGAAAILAGVLRAASSFAAGESEIERQALYFIVDLLLLLGVSAIACRTTRMWGAGVRRLSDGRRRYSSGEVKSRGAWP